MILVILLFVGYLFGISVNYLSDLAYEKPDRCNYLLPAHWKSLPKSRLKRAIVVLIISGISFPLLFLLMATFYYLLISYLLVIFLLWVVVVDVEHQEIMFRTTIAGFVFCLLGGIYLHGLTSSLLGGGAALIFQLIIFGFGLIYKKIKSLAGVIVEEEPFGFGDVTTSAILGLLLGWPYALIAVTLSGFLGGFYAWGVIITNKIKGKSINNMTAPHTPFIAASTVLAYAIFCLRVI